MGDTIRKYQDYVMTGFTRLQPIVVERAQGAIVTAADGRDYIDCFAGISVVNAGHSNPEVVAAARAQLEKLTHCCSYVYHVPVVADLAEKIAEIAPGGRLRKTFFANSGAEAIEGAMKLARLHTGRHEYLSLHGSFHGRTWGTLSITGNAGRKRRGGPYASGIAFAAPPYSYRSPFPGDAEATAAYAIRSVEEAIDYSTTKDVAAMIVEPVMGEGGMIVPPASYFPALKRVLDAHGILLIVDEVQSGFCRTGRLFAIEHFGVEPDILVMAKGIADGFPLGAFTSRDEIAAAFQPGDHLSTFGGNPVSCAAALANIRYMQRENLAERSRAKGELARGLLSALKSPLVGEIRGLGLMIGVELVKDAAKTPAAAEANAVRAACLENGVLLGVGGIHGNVLRLQPPLVISDQQLGQAVAVLGEALATVAAARPSRG
jgi:4-aminobutyrate aminotransferase / (S)-3-amino-2-methylpropionate transaminase / 5-aminovalerate transaminase